LLRVALAHAARHEPGRRPDRGALPGVARDRANQSAARRALGGSPGPRSLGVGRLLLGGGHLLLRLLLELERVDAGFLHRPLVALSFVLVLDARGLALRRKDIDPHGRGDRLLRGLRLRLRRCLGHDRKECGDRDDASHSRCSLVGRGHFEAVGLGVHAPKTETVLPSRATAIEESPVASSMTKLNARPISTPWTKISPPSRTTLRIGVERFSPLAFVVERTLSARFTSTNRGMFRTQGGSSSQSPSDVQIVAWTDAQRRRCAPVRSSAPARPATKSIPAAAARTQR